jgi:hypothetical protein
LKSGENYVGYERTESFASPGGARREKRQEYALPSRLRLNHWALSGDWTMGKEAIVLNQPNGRIVYRFHARDLHLVMGPAAPKGSRPIGPALMISVMLVAILTVDKGHGFFALNNGAELPILYITGAVTVAFAGPGQSWHAASWLRWDV